MSFRLHGHRHWRTCARSRCGCMARGSREGAREGVARVLAYDAWDRCGFSSPPWRREAEARSDRTSGGATSRRWMVGRTGSCSETDSTTRSGTKRRRTRQFQAAEAARGSGAARATKTMTHWTEAMTGPRRYALLFYALLLRIVFRLLTSSIGLNCAKDNETLPHSRVCKN